MMSESPLRKLYLYLTTRCNQHCIFCASDSRPTRSAHTASFQQSASFLKVNSPHAESVTISGGEPTVIEYLDKIISFAKSVCPKVVLHTNAVRLSDDAYLTNLLSAGVSCFAIPFFGMTEHDYDFLSGSHGLFERAMVGLRGAVLARRQWDVDVVLKILGNAYNVSILKDIPAFLDANSIHPTQISVHGLHLSESVLKMEGQYPDPVRLGEAYSNVIVECGRRKIRFASIEFPICLLSDDAIEGLLENTPYLSRPVSTIVMRPDGTEYVAANENWKPPSCDRCELSSFCQGFNPKNSWEYARFFDLSRLTPLRLH